MTNDRHLRRTVMSALITIKFSRYQLMLLRDISYDELNSLDKVDCDYPEEEESKLNNQLHLQEICDKIDSVLRDR